MQKFFANGSEPRNQAERASENALNSEVYEPENDSVIETQGRSGTTDKLRGCERRSAQKVKEMKSLGFIIVENQNASTVSAWRLVNKHGAKLIGQQVDTPQMGDYPGGVATVTEIEPDPSAPEIVFQVEHPTFGSIGVFENERVRMI